MLRYFYTCYFCGCFLGRAAFICEGCFKPTVLHEQSLFGLKHSYFYIYDYYGQVWVKNLKNGCFHQELERLTHHLLLPKEDRTIIALPSSNHSFKTKNHAYVLAKALFPQEEVVEPFFKVGEKQALKSRGARRQIKFEKTQEVHLKSKLVLVDDLVTSGSSVYAAWRLLGSPQNTEVYSLCYTPMSPSKVITKEKET